jgi:hypothetical protein
MGTEALLNVDLYRAKYHKTLVETFQQSGDTDRERQAVRLREDRQKDR